MLALVSGNDALLYVTAYSVVTIYFGNGFDSDFSLDCQSFLSHENR